MNAPPVRTMPWLLICNWPSPAWPTSNCPTSVANEPAPATDNVPAPPPAAPRTMAGSTALAAALTLPLSLTVRLPSPRLPTVSSPADFQREPRPSTTTEATPATVLAMLSATPNPSMLAPPLSSNVPALPRPTVIAIVAARLAPEVTFHNAVPPNCRAAAVPVLVIVPPPVRNCASSDCCGSDNAGFNPFVTSSQFITSAKPVPPAPVQSSVLSVAFRASNVPSPPSSTKLKYSPV